MLAGVRTEGGLLLLLLVGRDKTHEDEPDVRVCVDDGLRTVFRVLVGGEFAAFWKTVLGLVCIYVVCGSGVRF